jgi:cation transport ATPase-like protein
MHDPTTVPGATRLQARVDSATPTGLSADEARRRLEQEGPNELPRRGSHGPLHTALEVLREPMLLLLLAAGAVYLALGDREEAILLLASIGLIIGIELYQERRTERVKPLPDRDEAEGQFRRYSFCLWTASRSISARLSSTLDPTVYFGSATPRDRQAARAQHHRLVRHKLLPGNLLQGHEGRRPLVGC